MDLIYLFSQGVPRLINQICDSALLNGFIYEKSVIDEVLMREVIKESPLMQIVYDSQKDSDATQKFEIKEVKR